MEYEEHLEEPYGQEYVKRELFYDFTAQRYNHHSMGVSVMMQGTLLYGPDGCRPELLARRVALETSSYFATLDISRVLNEMDEAKNIIMTFFQEAQAQSQSILYIDHLDELLPVEGNCSYDQQVVLYYLQTAWQSLEIKDHIYVIGFTTRPWDLDYELRSHTFFHPLVFMPPPNTKERQTLIHTALHSEVNQPFLDLFNQYSASFTNDDLHKIITTARSKKSDKLSFQETLYEAMIAMKSSTLQWFAFAKQRVVFHKEYQNIHAYILEELL
ncbi:ATPase AAA [Fictibacillus macauensis ZFHKF-1]|uniref:ATPase AAA n=1 Tax=Fictibacillus macauensis ZFHKF-1 TaxID=1196324 RepID=I8AJV1_9BACL|nr:ATP-binding protein [Fictibacillus macauensis]EIT86072.1 ATPase AAA [Fictibacillus macauensis ZFHKF-1]